MKNPLLFFVCLVCMTFKLEAYNKTVAKDGSGDYTTVQAAIDAAPANGTVAYTIFIKNGVYKEKITVGSTKTFITLIGESVANVVLTYDDYSGKLIPGGGGATYGTSTSASTTINANDFTAVNISFENTTGESPQALAINVNGDRCAFKNCRFLGGQDTLLANGTGKRQYYKQCYIDGTVDFIFGNAIALFEDCTIYPKTRLSGTGNSYITAANTVAGQTYGYVFRNCIIQMNRGVTQYFLGRPWQNATGSNPFAENKVVFLNTTMSGAIVNPAGWSTWDVGTVTNLITFAEYQSVTETGAAVNVASRVAWSQQLNATQAATYTNANMLTTWDPCPTYTDMCNSTTLDIAVANLMGIKGASTSVFTWNASWGISGVTYQLQRSTDNQATFTSLYSVTSSSIYDVNFTYTDNNPPAGSTYYYKIVASKSGLASHTTAAISISSTPTITVGTAGAFLQGLGLPSAAQYYTLSAVNLLADLMITPPANYQISTDGGTTWSFTPLSITPVSGTISSRTVGLRVNSTTVGTFSGNIVHTSSGAADANVAVTGTVQADPLPISIVLAAFPLTANNSDDAAQRAAGVTVGTPTLTGLTLSNGTTVPAAPAYSTTHGQAFGAIADGTWTVASGGPGGNVNLNNYEQFTLTANSGYSVRVDSLTLNPSFYNTSSNTRLAVLYSKAGFASDISTATGGILGSDGTVLTTAAATQNSPLFTTTFALLNNTSGNTANYRLALNSSTGVTLTTGQTLTVRLYFSCGSGSAGRYAKIKDVFFKGLASPVIPLSILDIKAEKFNNNTNRVFWATADEKNVSHFETERSTDAQNFAVIGTTKANGNSNIRYDYTFIDPQPQQGHNYYRLKMVDADGSFTHTKIVSVDNTNGKSSKTKVFPNPFNDVLTLVFDDNFANKTALTVELTDVLGRSVWVKSNLTALQQIDIPTASLPMGTYFAHIKDGQTTVVYKVVK
jgi:pectin methylesterase-like acyl-CoA thioesterase